MSTLDPDSVFIQANDLLPDGTTVPPAVFVLRPGDHLVIALGQYVTHGDIDGWRQVLNERFPDICDRILLVGGAESLAVVPGDER